MVSDKEIWDDFKTGESYALSHMYYNYVHLLYGYGKKFVNDDNLVKDSIQDLFFELIRTRKNLGETDNIKFYLLCSFRRKLVSNIKKQNLSFSPRTESEWQLKVIDSAEHDYIEEEKRARRDKILTQALQSLSLKQREILYYRYTCEFDYEQICEIMSIKYDSARKQVFRALKMLKQVLSEADIFALFLLFSIKKQNLS